MILVPFTFALGVVLDIIKGILATFTQVIPPTFFDGMNALLQILRQLEGIFPVDQLLYALLFYINAWILIALYKFTLSFLGILGLRAVDKMGDQFVEPRQNSQTVNLRHTHYNSGRGRTINLRKRP